MVFGFGGRGRGLKRGRGGRSGVGPPSHCICPVCGEERPHEPGVPCFKQVCSKCGSPMTRPLDPEERP